MTNEVKIKGIYRHYKGNCYIVEDIATHCDNHEKYVVYKALYGDNKVWIRKYSDFVAEVDSKDQKYRFELIEGY